MRALAAAPTRSTATITVSWGIITIPMSLYTSVEETRVQRHERSAAGNPVGRQQIDKVTGEPVAYDSIRKVAVHDGIEVELSDDELMSITGGPGGIAEIVGLIDLGSIGHEYMPEKLYQARPREDKKAGQAAARAFALLTTALGQRDQAALVKVALRGGVAKYAALTPDGYMVVLNFVDAVRAKRPMPEIELPAAELALADKLLDAIGGPTVELVDESSAKVAEFVAAKAAGLAPVPVPAGAPPVAFEDMLSSLAASVEAAKAKKKEAS